MDVPVEILFEVGESGEEGPVSVAGVGGRIVVPGELADSGEIAADILVLAHHGGNGAIEWNRGTSCSHRADRGKEDLFFFDHVCIELQIKGVEDLINLNER